MKKLFTLLTVAALTLTASAVNLTVSTPNGTIMADGNILFNTPDPDWLADGEVSILGSVKVASDASVAAQVEVTLESGFEQYGVCIGQCVPVAVGATITRDVTIDPTTPLSIDFEPMMVSEMWEPSIIRTYVAKVKINVSGNTEKEFSVILSNDANASLHEMTSPAESFKVTGNYISWNLPAAPGVMTIYNVNGCVMRQYRLSTPSGSVQVSLPAGFYIWATPAHAGKICVRN